MNPKIIEKTDIEKIEENILQLKLKIPRFIIPDKSHFCNLNNNLRCKLNDKTECCEKNE